MPPARLLLLSALLLAACGEVADAPPAGPLGPELYVVADDDRPTSGTFLRYAVPGPGGGGLDVAVTDYAHPEGRPPVSLVGVVHVADPPYFEAMQELLDEYAIVLYEGLKPEDASAAEWQGDAARRVRSVATFQQDLASWFGFHFQMHALDYERVHFVHADMTMEQFLAAGGDGLFPDATSFDMPPDMRQTFEAVRAFGERALARPGPLRSLARRMFAKTMGTTDIGTALDMFPGLSELVLAKRNAVAIERLRAVLPDAEGPVAIFYGAAHMPDLERRLVGELGYERIGGRWLRAWALRAPLRR